MTTAATATGGRKRTALRVETIVGDKRGQVGGCESGGAARPLRRRPWTLRSRWVLSRLFVVPQDKLDLLQNGVPGWQFSVPVRDFMVTGTSAAEIAKIRPGFTWASGPDVLLHQDANGDYAEAILRKLALLL